LEEREMGSVLVVVLVAALGAKALALAGVAAAAWSGGTV